MDEREERAVWLKNNGYNCCQSVVKALTEDDKSLTDSEKELLGNVAAGFRTGMGGMQANCGALIGAVMAAGLRTKDSLKAGNQAREIHLRFTTLSGGNICKVLKSRRPDGTPVCPCNDCVRHAVRVFKEVVLSREEEE